MDRETSRKKAKNRNKTKAESLEIMVMIDQNQRRGVDDGLLPYVLQWMPPPQACQPQRQPYRQLSLAHAI